MNWVTLFISYRNRIIALFVSNSTTHIIEENEDAANENSETVSNRPHRYVFLSVFPMGQRYHLNPSTFRRIFLFSVFHRHTKDKASSPESSRSVVAFSSPRAVATPYEQTLRRNLRISLWENILKEDIHGADTEEEGFSLHLRDCRVEGKLIYCVDWVERRRFPSTRRLSLR